MTRRSPIVLFLGVIAENRFGKTVILKQILIVVV